MKQFFLFFFIFLLPLWVVAQVKQQIWTTNDRQNLLIGLKSSRADILKEVEKLSDKQIHFKPDSNQWSIAEVIEHLSVYEEFLYWDLFNNQYTEERYDLVDTVKGIDSAMTAYATDPNKGQAPFAVQPLGRFQKKEDLINFFNRYRNEVIKLVQETTADFRLHFIFRPADWGIWHIRDLHQYTLLWIAHTERHLNQITRIEATANFPK
jgi:DinB superfamily